MIKKVVIIFGLLLLGSLIVTACAAQAVTINEPNNSKPKIITTFFIIS